MKAARECDKKILITSDAEMSPAKMCGLMVQLSGLK